MTVDRTKFNHDNLVLEASGELSIVAVDMVGDDDGCQARPVARAT